MSTHPSSPTLDKGTLVMLGVTKSDQERRGVGLGGITGALRRRDDIRVLCEKKNVDKIVKGD